MINYSVMFKFCAAVALLFLALYFGLIDLSLILRLDGSTILIVCVIVFCSLIVSSIRWLILMRHQAPNLAFARILQINFIGMFFNLFLPSSVGGDLIRARYIIKETQSNRSAGVVSILFDRYIGLLGTLYVATFLTSLLFDNMAANHVLLAVALTICVGALIATLALFSGLYFTEQILGWDIFEERENNVRIKILLRKLISAIAAYRNHSKAIIFAIGCTLLAQTLVLSAFIILAGGMGFGGLSGAMLALAASVATFFSIIPISPGGLGVGEAAFATFAELYTSGQLTAGIATVYFAFRAFTFPFALFGGIVFIVFKPAFSTETFESITKNRNFLKPGLTNDK